ncbi:MAG: tRNA (adenosine(37)-N6)-threonylcarbamoyltransferase complex ATPase subunit type 1 TsaE [Candidatus Gastranaerophilales bacterium]|nr:tRNA (adenosine(37)-N6)-threonylcarbamoyltransferase complex ATPase subunit type 1 TsaE [Candidatus Gastranaerophilales bacterium]
MDKVFSIICKNLDDTENLAEKFAKLVEQNGAFVCLYGDIGAGKTAFSKFLCKHLGVSEKVTSPSFVILNEYKTGRLPIYHFDLYRLENEGVKTITDELEEYSQGKILTLVEWAEFSDMALPFDRLEIKINYLGETEREFAFSAFGSDNEAIIKEIKNEILNV